MLGNSLPLSVVMTIVEILSRSSWDWNWSFNAFALFKTGDPSTVIVEIKSLSFLVAFFCFHQRRCQIV